MAAKTPVKLGATGPGTNTFDTSKVLKVGTREKWLISLLFTAGLWLLVYGLFIYTLHLPFPEGVLWPWSD